jgi:hypothetical protein
MRYFEQHEIPQHGPSGYDYKYTRALKITAKGNDDGNGVIETFQAYMEDAFLTGGQYPGIPKSTSNEWANLIPHLFDVSLARGNPFDFALWYPSRIAFFLVGDFWRFSTKMAPFTTKHQYGAQYFDLLLHYMDAAGLHSITQEDWDSNRPEQPCKCVSFSTLDPCLDSALGSGNPKVLHGFSLNLEVAPLLANGTIHPDDYLPLTIDPDVENKGGHP